MRASLVAIDGPDGSGKSQLADALARACAAAGMSPAVYHVDDFKLPVAFDAVDAAGEAQLYYDRYYDFGALAARMAAADAATAVAIVEGVLVLRVPGVAGAPRIWLDVSDEEARRRIFTRDRRKGRSDDEIARRIARRYLPALARYRVELGAAESADLVIDNTSWQRPTVRRGSFERFPPPVAAALRAILAVDARRP